jgi:hypothetical protein
MTKTTKQIIIAIIVIVAIFIGYRMLFPGEGSNEATLAVDQPAAAQIADSQVILALLDKLDKIKLDDSIFSDKVFIRLVDFGQPIPEQSIGRQNPFLPIGRDTIVVTPVKSTKSNTTPLIR